MVKILKFVIVAVVIVLAVQVGYQLVTCAYANAQLSDDLHDLSAQVGTHIGLDSPRTDDDFRRAVIRKADSDGIELQPEQVTVERSGSDYAPTMYLAADYRVTIKLLPGYLYSIHFTPSSGAR